MTTRPTPTRWILLGLALAVAAPAPSAAQDIEQARDSLKWERLRGAERRALRLNPGYAGQGDFHLGGDADFGLSRWFLLVASLRRWGYSSYGCTRLGPVSDDHIILPAASRSCLR